jgi:CRISPR-associated protein Csx17
LADKEEKTARAELWLPLWHQPAQYAAIHHLFAEGRAQVGRRSVENGLDFARAVSSLGVDQGIDAFQRYGFLVRNGLAYLAAPLGRIRVAEQPHVRLIDEVDTWLNRLRSAADENAPGSLAQAVRELDRAIFAYCQRGHTAHLQGVLIALGRAQLMLGLSRNLQERHPQPLHHLSTAWIAACNDETAEFRIALALASITHPKIGPLRLHWEPLAWSTNPNRFTWVDPTQREAERGTLSAQLLSLLERRLIMGERLQVVDSLQSRCYATLADIDAFLNGQTDDARIWALLHGLATLKWHVGMSVQPERTASAAPLLSRSYALLKLLYLPHAIPVGAPESVQVWSERSVLGRLRAGRMPEAMALAQRRLFASGLIPFGHRHETHLRYRAPLGDPIRLGAALLIPIHPDDVTKLCAWVIQPPKIAR